MHIVEAICTCNKEKRYFINKKELTNFHLQRHFIHTSHPKLSKIQSSTIWPKHIYKKYITSFSNVNI